VKNKKSLPIELKVLKNPSWSKPRRITVTGPQPTATLPFDAIAWKTQLSAATCPCYRL